MSILLIERLVMMGTALAVGLIPDALPHKNSEAL